jgi:hypothetical protein
MRLVWEPEKVNQIIFSSHYKCKWILSSLVNDMKSDLFWTSESYWASAEASVKLVKLLSCNRLTVTTQRSQSYNLDRLDIFWAAFWKERSNKKSKSNALNWSWKKKHLFLLVRKKAKTRWLFENSKFYNIIQLLDNNEKRVHFKRIPKTVVRHHLVL